MAIESCLDSLHPTHISKTCSKCSSLLSMACDAILDDSSYLSRSGLKRSISIALEMVMERSVIHGIKIGLDAQKKADAETLSRYKQQLEHARLRAESSTRAQAVLQEAVQQHMKEAERLRAILRSVDDIYSQQQSDDSEEEEDFDIGDSDEEVDSEGEPQYEYDYGWDTSDTPFQGLSLHSAYPYGTQQETSYRALDHTMIDDGQMKLWIHLAQYPGNERFVKAISKLYSQARAVRGSKRSKVQHYLLENWTTFSHTGSPSRLAFSDDTIDLIVDASNHGIGVVLHDIGWQGWKFKDSPKLYVGMDGNIIASWAELIAVEVGIRMYIKEGYTCPKIFLQSDNKGVLKALKKGYWQDRFELNTILQRILGLCRVHGIKITPCWISTRENPADPISRGVYPGVDVLEPIYCIPSVLPRALAKILAPAYV